MPHDHILLWVKNVPWFGVRTNENIEHFVDKYLTTNQTILKGEIWICKYTNINKYVIWVYPQFMASSHVYLCTIIFQIPKTYLWLNCIWKDTLFEFFFLRNVFGCCVFVFMHWWGGGGDEGITSFWKQFVVYCICREI